MTFMVLGACGLATVTWDDNGEPGRNDDITLDFSPDFPACPPDQGEVTIDRGNIQWHKNVRGAGTGASAAGAAVFPSGAAFNGIPLQGSTYGLGVVIDPSGSAVGDVLIVLECTTLLGNSQTITLEGNATSGAVNAGSATFSGTGTLDMGDGSLPATVPFSVTATADGLLLPIGTTVLPLASVSEGGITIGQP